MKVSSLVLIGASTGGPGRIYSILESLDDDFNGTIVIAQHMNESFFESFVHQLKALSKLPVSLVNREQPLECCQVYVCSKTSRLIQKKGEIWIEPTNMKGFSYNPQIDILFSSAASLPSSLKRLGVILTGIGEDGALGALQLFQSGGKCIYESELSAIVFGMPRRAKELNPDANIGDISEIIRFIRTFGSM